jgi:hypothetical protein
VPLDAVNFHPLGPVKSDDMLQFYNLLTGVMQDQPITSRNALSIGGNQGQTTVPLKVYGATGQNTNLIDLYVDRTAAQPGFGLTATGTFAWGPGGTAPQDTYMSRIALQNGHATDTPGVLVAPLLEVAGTLTSTRLVAPNGTAYPTSPAPVNGDLYYRHDLNKLYVYDQSSAAWVTSAATFEELVYGTYNHTTATTYDVAVGINMVFVTIAGATVRLPAASGAAQKSPITISPNFNITVSVTAVSGGVYGGSINPNTGAMTNGSIVSTASAMDSVSYKSDGASWRAV